MGLFYCPGVAFNQKWNYHVLIETNNGEVNMIREISYKDALSLQEDGMFRRWLSKHHRKFGLQYPLLKNVIRSFAEDTIQVEVEPCAEMIGIIRHFSGITLNKREIAYYEGQGKRGHTALVYRSDAKYVMVDYRTYHDNGSELPKRASATFVRK